MKKLIAAALFLTVSLAVAGGLTCPVKLSLARASMQAAVAQLEDGDAAGALLSLEDGLVDTE